jgi:tetratricopeptide (TPR) repeat protein
MRKTLIGWTAVVSVAMAVTALTPAAMAVTPVDERAHAQALEHYRAGQDLMYSEKWADAEREFRAAIALDPLLVLAHYGLGQAYMNMKQYPEAVRAFTGCRQAYLDLAALQATDRAKADQRMQEEITELRDSLRTIQSGKVKLAQPDMTVLRIENRISDLENAKRRGSGGAVEVPAEFSLALGSAYFRSGALADAQREYEAALKTNSKFGEAHNNLAVVLMLQGQLPQASEHLKAAEKAGFHVNPAFKADLEKRLERK